MSGCDEVQLNKNCLFSHVFELDKAIYRGSKCVIFGSRQGWCCPGFEQTDIHPIDEDLSLGTPGLHPTDQDLSVGTPAWVTQKRWHFSRA